MARRVHESIEVQAPVQEVFRYWSDFKNASKFMQNVAVSRNFSVSRGVR